MYAFVNSFTDFNVTVFSKESEEICVVQKYINVSFSNITFENIFTIYPMVIHQLKCCQNMYK